MDEAPFEQVTSEQIGNLDRELQEQFEEKTAAVSKVMIEMACPHCGQTFKVDSSEIHRRAKAGRAEGQDEM